MSVTLFYKGGGNGPVCAHLARMAKEHFGETFTVVRDKQLPTGADILVRWGSSREAGARRPFNSREAVKLCNDKRASRKVLKGICPETWDKSNAYAIKFPCILRPRKHFGGKNLHVVNNEAEFAVLRKRYWNTGWYASEIVKKAAEYRIFVLQGRILACTQKFPADANAVAWNIHQGGHTQMMTRKHWDPKLLTIAIEAAKRLGLTWGAVDLYTDVNGKSGVFEVNTAPGITTDRALKRLARALIWADRNPAPVARTDAIASWKDIIHPALLEVPEEEPKAPETVVEVAPVPVPVVPEVRAFGVKAAVRIKATTGALARARLLALLESAAEIEGITIDLDEED